MSVRPLHHWRNSKIMCLILLHYSDTFQRLRWTPSHFFVSENKTLFARFRRLSVMVLCTE